MKMRKLRKTLVWNLTIIIFLSSTNVFAMYDPAMMRFTSRDPVRGKYEEPLTLHRYLYCVNDSINKVDPEGEWFSLVGGLVSIIAGEALRKADASWSWSAGAYAIGAISTLHGIYVLPQDVKNLRNGRLGQMIDNYIDRWFEYGPDSEDDENNNDD